MVFCMFVAFLIIFVKTNLREDMFSNSYFLFIRGEFGKLHVLETTDSAIICKMTLPGDHNYLVSSNSVDVLHTFQKNSSKQTLYALPINIFIKGTLLSKALTCINIKMLFIKETDTFGYNLYKGPDL